MGTVSIVVPVYKVEAYLPQCIDSILTQTYSDIQLILIDDGSPDNCGAICDVYAAKDERVLALHKKNGGVSSARNLGLRYVTGEYLTFCDSDDMYQPEWIENLVTAAQKSKADLVLGNYSRFFDGGEPEPARSHESGITDIAEPDAKVAYCFDKIFSDKHAWEIWTRLFRADIVREYNLQFFENCENFAEDLGFTLSYTIFANRVVSIDAAGYLYRVRNGSMMWSSAGKARLNAVNEVFLSFDPVCRKAFDKDRAEQILPIFHFLIMYQQYLISLRDGDYRRLVEDIAKISRQKDWEYWVRRLLKCKKELIEWFGKYNAERILLLMHFCLHRNAFRYKVERRLFYMLRNKMDDCYGNEM